MAGVPEIVVRAAEPGDRAPIAALYLRSFPTARLARLGPAVVASYVDAMLDAPRAIAVVAGRPRHELQGFAIGLAGSPRAVWLRPSRAVLRLALALGTAAIRRPGRIASLLRGARAHAGAPPAAAEGLLAAIAVAPEFQGRGVGRALLDSFVGRIRAQGVSRLALEVEPASASAVALYESVGFVWSAPDAASGKAAGTTRWMVLATGRDVGR